ncbi:MAG: hypothetical protein WCO05_01885 [Candidatus Moraniibacteriota bacterium]|jgi:hypothetical protein
MLESKLKDLALETLGDKITDEEEKNKISEELRLLERELDDDISRVLRELRRDLDENALRSKFSSSERDDIVKKVGENIKRSEYAGV